MKYLYRSALVILFGVFFAPWAHAQFQPSVSISVPSTVNTGQVYNVNVTASDPSNQLLTLTVYRNGVYWGSATATWDRSSLLVSGNDTAPASPGTVTWYATVDSDSSSANTTSVVTVVSAGDTTAPSVPTGLAANTITSSSFNLTWNASTDNVGVTGYEVQRDSTSLGPVGGTSLGVSGLAASTAYSMTVRARDAAGNWSGWSSPLSVTTGAATPPPTGSLWGTTNNITASAGAYAFTPGSNISSYSWNALKDGVAIATGYSPNTSSTGWGYGSGPGTYQFYVTMTGPGGTANTNVITTIVQIPRLSTDFIQGVAPATFTVASGTNITASGWAADYQNGAPIPVTLYIDGVARPGAITNGQSRPDVQTASVANGWSPFNDVTASGWTASFNSSALSLGAHTMYLAASDSFAPNNAAYTVVSPTFSFTVINAAPVNVSISVASTFAYGQSIPMTARSTDATGDLVAQHIVVSNSSYTTNNWEGTDPSGWKWHHFMSISTPLNGDTTSSFTLSDNNYGQGTLFPPGVYHVTLNTQDSVPNYTYDPSNVMATFTVTKANQSVVTISSPSSGTYGTTYTATATGGTGTGALVWSLGSGSTAAGAAIDANTGVITANSSGLVVIKVYRAGDANYNPSAPTADTTITIVPRPITVTLAGSKTYDGTTTSTGASATLTTGTLAAGDSIAYAYGPTSSPNVGPYVGIITPTVTNASAPTTRTTSYAVSYAGGYAITKATPPPPTINPPGIVIYGNPLTMTATGNGGTGALVWALGTGSTAAGAFINSSTGAVTFNSTGIVVVKVQRTGDANYNTSAFTSDYVVTISPRAITITLSGSKPYDGTTTSTGASASITTGSLAPGDTIAYIYAGTSSATAGSYPGLVTATISNATAPTTRTPSYTITFGGNYIILPVTPPAPTITSPTTGTYGTPYTATATGNGGTGALVWALGTGSTASGAAINSVSGAVTANSSGSVVIKVQRTGDANYNTSPYSADFSVAFAARPITVTLSGSKTYDGTTVATGASATITSGNLASGDSIGYVYNPTGSANAGSYTGLAVPTISNAVAPLTRTSSYAITYAGNFIISVATPPAPTITSASSGTYGTYAATATGNGGTGALVWALGTGSNASGAAIDPVTGVVTANSTGTVVIKVQRAADANYALSPFSADFPVALAARPITVTLSGSKPYDGTTTPTGASAAITAGSLASGDSAGYVYAATSSSAPGTYPGLATPTVTNATAPTTRTGSYAITSAGAYTITMATPPAPTITSSSSATYGTAYTATATGNGGTGALAWALGTGSTASGAAIDPATGVITANSSGSVVIKVQRAADANYTLSPFSADFPVNFAARPITVTLSGAKNYDGTTTAAGASAAITAGTLAGSDTIGYAYAATSSPSVGTYGGLAIPTISNAAAPLTRTGSYAITYAGVYTINKTTPPAPTITSSSSGTYGTPYTATATANGGTGALAWALGTGSSASGAAIDPVTGVITANSTGTVVFKVQQAADANYNLSAYSADFTVTLAARPITVTLAGSKNYDGTTVSTGAIATITTGSLASGDSIGYAYAATSSAVPGTYPGLTTATITNATTPTTRTPYYAITYAGVFTINKAPQTAVTITSPTTGTYGTAYTATASGGTGTGALVWALGTGSTASGAAINSATGAVTATSSGTVVINVYRAGDTNYNASATTTDFPVTFAPRPITVTLSGSRIYNATTASTGASAAITSGNLAAGDTIAYAYAATSSANVGTYPGLATPTISNVTAPTTRTGSYAITYAGVYTITVAPQPAVTINSSASSIYGNSYTATATGGAGTGALVWSLVAGGTATGGDIDPVTGVVTANSFGTVIFKVYRAAESNYTASATTANFTVTFAKRAITVTLSGTKSYDGTTASTGASAAITTGTLGGTDTIGYVFAATSSAVPGSYPGLTTATVSNVTAPANRSASYTITYAGSYTITKATPPAPTITSATTSIYGPGYTATATGNGGTGALVWALGTGSTATGPAINSSTGAVTSTSTGIVYIKVQRAADTNYNLSPFSADFPITVGVRSITVTLGGSKAYNGTTVATGATGTVTTGTLATGDTAAYVYAATGSAAPGSYSGLVTATISNATAPTNRTANYAITYAGSYTITKATPAAPSITSAATGTYGTAYTGVASAGPSTGALVWALGAAGTASGAAIDPATGVVTETSNGTVLIKVMRLGDANYNDSPYSVDKTVTFAARPITVTLTGSRAYDGTTASTGANATITTGTLAAGDTVAYAYAATGSANAGTYPGLATPTISNATAPLTRTSSYAITYAGNYTITKVTPAAPTITSPTTGVYGTTYTATASAGPSTGALVWALGTGSTASGAAIDPATGIITANSSGIVGIKVQRAADINYNASPFSANFPVTFATRPITVTLGGSKIYDGTNAPTGATVTMTAGTLATGDTLGYSLLNTSSANAGTYTGLITSLVISNVAVPTTRTTSYAVTIAGSFVINPAPTTFALSATSFFFTGTPHGPTVIPTPSAATFTTGGTLVATAIGSYTATATANGNYTGSNNGLNWSIIADNVPPTSPTSLLSSNLTATGFTLNWTASTDNIGVTLYEVFLNGVSQGTTTTLSMNLSGLNPGTSYTVTVRSRDAAGNWSTPSTGIIVMFTGVPFLANFEPVEGYQVGALQGQNGWNVTGTANIVTSPVYLGVQALSIPPAATASFTTRAFTGSTPAVTFIDLFALPAAAPTPDAGVFIETDVIEVALTGSAGVGMIQAFNGNGTGGGAWVTTGVGPALDGTGKATAWGRFTIRCDYINKKWDLYYNGQMIIANLGFISNSATALGALSLGGHTAATTGFDELFIDFNNPLFVDADKDGMDDNWESTHGLNPAVNDRDGDLDGDGLTNIQEYILGTNPNSNDSNGDGTGDGQEVDSNGLGIAWQLYYFGHTGVDPNADPDGDGISNLNEYLTGRNPTKGNVADTTNAVNLRVYSPTR